MVKEIEIDKWKMYLEQLQALGGVEKKDNDVHEIHFSAATLCGLYGLELYFDGLGERIIGGRNENRIMPLEEVLQIIKRFNHNYFYNFKIKRWQGGKSLEETARIKDMINYKIKEMKNAGKRKTFR